MKVQGSVIDLESSEVAVTNLIPGSKSTAKKEEENNDQKQPIVVVNPEENEDRTTTTDGERTTQPESVNATKMQQNSNTNLYDHVLNTKVSKCSTCLATYKANQVHNCFQLVFSLISKKADKESFKCL